MYCTITLPINLLPCLLATQNFVHYLRLQLWHFSNRILRFQSRMRAVVQRVTMGSVAAEGEIVGSIRQGLAVLLGISRDDDHTDSDYVVRKLLTLKLFSDEPNKRWQKSVKEANLELLIISQFTLCHTFKGTKPDFHNSMGADQSRLFFEEFIECLKKEYATDKIQCGKFGCHMVIDLKLDGPVTLIIDSPVKKNAGDQNK